MSEHAHDQSHHITPPSVYIKTLIVLTILMVLTIAVAVAPVPFLHETKAGSVVANVLNLTIASIKATLVVLFFMGVKKSTTLVKFWAVLGFAWFPMLYIMFLDYGTRHLEPTHSWSPDTGTAMTRNQPRDPAIGTPVERSRP